MLNNIAVIIFIDGIAVGTIATCVVLALIDTVANREVKTRLADLAGRLGNLEKEPKRSHKKRDPGAPQ